MASAGRRLAPPVNALTWLGSATKFIHRERGICEQHMKKGRFKMEDTTPNCPATKPRGPGSPRLIRASCSSTQPHVSTSRILLSSTADPWPVNSAASSTSSLAPNRRPRHYMATQLYTTVITTQQQTKTKSRQVSRKPHSPDCTTTFDINKYYICVVLQLSIQYNPTVHSFYSIEEYFQYKSITI